MAKAQIINHSRRRVITDNESKHQNKHNIKVVSNQNKHNITIHNEPHEQQTPNHKLSGC